MLCLEKHLQSLELSQFLSGIYFVTFHLISALRRNQDFFHLYDDSQPKQTNATERSF